MAECLSFSTLEELLGFYSLTPDDAARAAAITHDFTAASELQPGFHVRLGEPDPFTERRAARAGKRWTHAEVPGHATPFYASAMPAENVPLNDPQNLGRIARALRLALYGVGGQLTAFKMLQDYTADKTLPGNDVGEIHVRAARFAPLLIGTDIVNAGHRAVHGQWMCGAGGSSEHNATLGALVLDKIFMSGLRPLWADGSLHTRDFGDLGGVMDSLYLALMPRAVLHRRRLRDEKITALVTAADDGTAFFAPQTRHHSAYLKTLKKVAPVMRRNEIQLLRYFLYDLPALRPKPSHAVLATVLPSLPTDSSMPMPAVTPARPSAAALGLRVITNENFES